MDRNTTLAFILIGAILILWLYTNTPEPPKQTPRDSDTLVVKKDTLSQEQDQTKDISESEEVVSEDSLNFGRFFTRSGVERIISVENELYRLELSTKGGSFYKFFLKKFDNWYASDDEEVFYKRNIQLINYLKGSVYNLAFVTTDGRAINTSELFFEADKNESYYKINGNDSITINFTLGAGDNRKIIKTFTFFGNEYRINSNIDLINMNNVISNNSYDIVWDSGIRFVEENTVDEATYSNASLYYGGEQVIVDASSVGETYEEDFNGRVDWIAVRNKYFASIIVPDKPEQTEGAYIKGNRVGYPNQGIIEFYSTRLTIPFKNTSREKHSFFLYIGPVDYDILKDYGHNLISLVDFGSFFGLKFIVRPIAEYILLPLFNFLHTFIPNYGFVIIVFSLIIKFVLYPLTKSSYQSMKRMQLLQPKMAEIREKFKDDPQKMNKEMMKLYSTYGVNPAGGCFPLLLQMPIFVALWGLFQTAIELRQQPFIFWINDLSRPDVIAHLPFQLPLFGIDKISGLALLMGITTFIQQKMTVKDPKQQALIYVMPVMLTLMFMSFPSGLNLYYFMFNVFSIAQQYYINHQHSDMVLEPVKNPKKSKGFMQKLMEAAEQNAKAQQQRRKR